MAEYTPPPTPESLEARNDSGYLETYSTTMSLPPIRSSVRSCVRDEGQWQINSRNDLSISRIDSAVLTTDNTSNSILKVQQTTTCPSPHLLIDMGQCPAFPLAPQLHGVVSLPGVRRTPFERLEFRDDGSWLEKAWCFKHKRMEFSHSALVPNEKVHNGAKIEVQRAAGRLVLFAAAITFAAGGCILLHSMVKGGKHARWAMLEASHFIGDGGIIVAEVHRKEAQLAAMVEAILGCGLLVGILSTVIWLIITRGA